MQPIWSGYTSLTTCQIILLFVILELNLSFHICSLTWPVFWLCFSDPDLHKNVLESVWISRVWIAGCTNEAVSVVFTHPSAAVIFLCFKMTLISEQVSVSLFLNVSSSVHQRRSSEVGGDSSLLINQTNIPDEPHTEEFYTRYLLIDLRGRSEVVSCRCPNANSSWSIAEGAGFTW